MNVLFIPNTILAGLADEFMGTISVEYQRALGARLVLTLAPEVTYLSTDIQYDRYNYDTFTGWGGGLLVGLRYLFTGEGLSGFYLEVQTGAGWIDGGKTGYISASGNMLACLVEAGYAHTWGSGFTLGAGVGFSSRWFVWHKESIPTTLVTSPWARLDLGYAW